MRHRPVYAEHKGGVKEDSSKSSVTIGSRGSKSTSNPTLRPAGTGGPSSVAMDSTEERDQSVIANALTSPASCTSDVKVLVDDGK